MSRGLNTAFCSRLFLIMNVVFGSCVVCLYDLFKMSVRERPRNSTVNCRLHQLGGLVSGGLKSGSLR